MSSWKMIGLAVALFLFSAIGGAVAVVVCLVNLDPINALLGSMYDPQATTALGKFLPVFIAFGLGSVLGPAIGGRLLQKCGVATREKIMRARRVFSKRPF